MALLTLSEDHQQPHAPHQADCCGLLSLNYGQRHWAIVLVIAVLANALVLSTGSFLLRFAASFILACLLPGFMLVGVLLPGLQDPLERVVLSVGAGYGLLTLVALGIHYLPGPITPCTVLFFYNSLALILLLCLLRWERVVIRHSPLPRGILWRLALLLLLASFFRLTYLGYSEFQGDEAKVMLRAAEIIQGRDDVLFLHKKGPAEILIPAVFYSISKRTNEFIARFPFALANLAGLMAMYLLGRRMFGERVGFVTALLLAIEGYLVAFSRIVQYQSMVFLMTTLSLLCFYRFFRSKDGGHRHLILGSFFAGVGLLAHYDALFALPVGLYLLFKKARVAGWGVKEWVCVALPPLIVLALIVLPFYIPFVLHPHFQKAYIYIVEKRVGKAAIPRNNLSDFFLRSTFYNSTYYIVFLILLMGIAIFIQLQRSLTNGLAAFAARIGLKRAAFYRGETIRHLTNGLANSGIGMNGSDADKLDPGETICHPRSPLGILLPMASIMALIAASLFPSWWRVGQLDVAIFPFAIVFLLLLASPAPPPELKCAFLWLAGPFLLYSFFIQKVHTHYHVALVPWALIGGFVIEQGWKAVHPFTKRHRLLRGMVGILALSLLCLFAYYIFIVFVSHNPEYKRTYPQHKSRLYWTAYGAKLPRGGYFGFPYRAGWKVIGYLYREGVLRGDYDSNEKRQVTAWYTRGELRCSSAPRYYFIAKNVQDVRKVPMETIREKYELVGRVLVDGEPKLWIYQRSPATSLQDYDLE
ncbi:MAG TPA: phospholipid carrier-dependent glycosyltransferase [Anaerolineae bacterium]|nr:phospholipid carrier-dependent glycosyltransferase [Anaerolineae bacterium]